MRTYKLEQYETGSQNENNFYELFEPELDVLSRLQLFGNVGTQKNMCTSSLSFLQQI